MDGAASGPLVLAAPTGLVATFLLVATRLLSAVLSSPVLSTRGVPAQARLGLGLFAALVLTPVVGQSAIEPDRLTWAAIAGEVIVGALAGFAATLLYTAVQFGAGLVNVQAGFSLGAVYDPTVGEATTTIERFYGMLAALVFLQLNGHHYLLLALKDLFTVVPVGSLDLLALHPATLGDLAGSMMRFALLLVVPVVAALLLTDVALAVLARAAPQFNVFVVGMPVKAAVAMGAMFVGLPLLVPRMEGLIRVAISASEGVFR